ncbi:MAG: dihydroxyacetone kinase subunit L [Bacteroidales bacterium]|jgi:dihydroxyacetone kinase-like protein|nr:dihydroxyacetone kinase subunit L [Bacteroidales bacterium]MBQ1906461.1 dihydroxyacetone kinase subunit L [Bacteroidales bacterium]MBQ2501088.1 dihydroxyacetone kinase subunit L [Bacteroidales bacterium]MBQ3985260.1 dihydroxyacetone kinase subunit L [Bacteroidales bacterium]MBQ4169719.1 dihydroxyacetone kinase subunit L [Bacteroidales bacterium]
MDKFTQEAGSLIVDRLILAIQENKQYLSDIDGAIGDGDHGINMNKGFTLCREALDKQPGDFTYGLKTLGKILMMKIGGSMGPLYGKFFLSIGKALDGVPEIGKEEFGAALNAALDAIHAISPAQVGDKTLMDVLIPAQEAYNGAAGASFAEALDAMDAAALKGRDSTVDMVAKLGRSSRLGERSRGVMDAGSASCYLILHTMADTIKELLGA